NRDRSEIEGLIGFFVNTLIMRTYLGGNPSFLQLLSRVREIALGAYAHQDLPFEMLVEALQPERNLTHTPLFQVMFVLQNMPMSGVGMAGLTISSLPIESQTAKFDLTLGMQKIAAGLVGVWEYNTDLFDAVTIEHMTGHFVTLLEGIVANPQQHIAQLPLLTQPEQQQLLFNWNNTQSNYPCDKCIHQLFEEQVQHTPDAVAVVYVNAQSSASGRVSEQLTYQQLNTRADQLAYYLRSLGVKADTLVGICVERSLEMVVGLLGILKSGGAYVPIDPNYPLERIKFMLEDAGASVLLTQSFLKNQLPVLELQHPLQVICLDEATFTAELADNPSSANYKSDLAYVIYTSGSTGRPKGVMIEHQAIANLSLAWAKTCQIQSESRLLQFGSFSFDLSVAEIATTLITGASLYLASKETLLPSQTLVNFLAQYKITHSFLSPSALSILPQANLPDLQSLAVGGEACPAELVTQWSQGRRFYNCYGPTESTVTAAIALCQPNGKKPSIGKPISNLRIYILDANNQLLPPGIPGELCIAGVGLARGYLNRPETSAEKFVCVEFFGETERIYKTGDLARWRLDGNLEYLGRIDDQVKIRGFRIELGEIEAVLNQHSDVQVSCVIAREDTPLPDGNIEYLGRIDNQVKVRGFRIELGEIETVLDQSPHVQTSCAIVREDTPGDKRLFAYIVPHQQSTITSNELRQFLKAKLPDYMVPNAFVILESMPLTPNGKIDRRALPALDLDSDAYGALNLRPDKYIAPRTPIEEMLAQIWSQLLGVEQVGIHDNFFELGGHSLLATQLISRIRDQFKVQLPLRELFNAATIAELGQSISKLQQQNSDSKVPRILPRSKRKDDN
ncbi:MAG: amino acid adenylation domain-containing protein, partial [Rhizonema sp. PD38]|nr:amino acid adenylation domain-containing protein [Rhizonema sp. PD38]